MIHEAFNKSEIARRYFLAKGESLSRQEAVNRWRMVKNVDKKILSNVVNEVSKEQQKLLKKKDPYRLNSALLSNQNQSFDQRSC